MRVLLLLLLIFIGVASGLMNFSTPMTLPFLSQVTMASTGNETMIVGLNGSSLVQLYSSDRGLTWATIQINLIGNFSNPTLGASYPSQWMLALNNNSDSIVILKTTEPSIANWTFTYQHNGSYIGLMSIAVSFDSRWNLFFQETQDSFRYLRLSGFYAIWSSFNYSLPNCTNLNSYTYDATVVILAGQINGKEFAKRFYGGTPNPEIIISNTSSMKQPQIYSYGTKIIILLGSGEIVISNNSGVSWSLPIMVASPNSVIASYDDQNWMILSPAPSLTSYKSSDGGVTWNSSLINSTSIDGLKITSIQGGFMTIYWKGTNYYSTVYQSIIPIVGSPSSYLASPSITSLQISINQTLTISSDLKINSSLLVYGSLELNSSLSIKGDFYLANSSTLNLTQSSQLITVSGTFTPGGTLITPINGTGSLILVSYDSLANTTFSQIVKNECDQITYGQSALTMTFSSGCTSKEGMPLWQILVISGAVLIVAIAVAISLFFFRKKIFPYADREHWKSSIERPMLRRR